MNLQWPEQMPASGRVTKNKAMTPGRPDTEKHRAPARCKQRQTGAHATLIWISKKMMSHPISQRLRQSIKVGLLSGIALSLSACAGLPVTPETTYPPIPQRVELLGGGTKSLNYTPWYIHTWEMSGPTGMGIGGGGPNVMPAHEDGSPSGGGAETCCTSYPLKWQSDLRLTVRWLVFKDVKKLGAKAPGDWYKAENVQIAKYDGNKSGGIWAIFLPDDRVRLMIADGNSSEGNDLNHRPPDNDPYIAQGVRDDEWNQFYRKGGNTQ